MRKRILWTLVALAWAGSLGAQTVEVDPGVWVELPKPAPLQQALSSHLTGVDIAIDLTHNTGRQGLVTSGYGTLQNDLLAHGATLTFINAGPLTLPLLQQYDAWWIEEDWGSVFSAAEKNDLVAYVQGGGCLFFNGDEHGLSTAEHGAIIALFNLPFANTGAVGGFTNDITSHFLTDPFAPSGFPGAVTQVLVPGATNTLAPVFPAFDVVRLLGKGIVGVYTLGAGGVVVFADELAIDFFVNQADNRTLANRVFEFCAFGLVIEVDIDIKFCSDPNGFNCKSKGKTPVTIFGSASLDVNDIDISSLQLCEDGNPGNCTGSPLDWSVADRGDPTTDLGAAMCAIDPITGEELDWLNQDGLDDLDVAFATQEIVSLIGCDALNKGDASLTLVLVGQTLGGTPITSVAVGDVGIDQLLIQNN